MSVKLPPIVALVLGVFVTMAGANEILNLQGDQVKALGIEAMVAGTSVTRLGATFPARVQVPTEQMRVVSAPVGGILERLAVAPGAVVRKGQVVAQLASPQALELQRDAVQAASQSNLLQENLKRDEVLFAEGLIAESRLRASRAAAVQASVQARERQLGLKLAGISTGKLGSSLPLASPIDGVVLEQGVQLGQRIEPSAMIYRIAKLSPLWLEIQAPFDTVAGLSQGTPVKVVNSDVTGRLIAVGRVVDPASQTVLLRAEVAKGAEALTVGEAVEVELAAPNARGQWIPSSALIHHNGKTFSFVQVGDDKASRFEARPVRILNQGGSMVLVEGIQPGERIVTKGMSGLKAMLAGVGRE